MLMNLNLYFNKVKVNTPSKYVTCLIIQNKRHKAASKINLFLFANKPLFVFPGLDLQLSVSERGKKRSKDQMLFGVF